MRLELDSLITSHQFKIVDVVLLILVKVWGNFCKSCIVCPIEGIEPPYLLLFIVSYPWSSQLSVDKRLCTAAVQSPIYWSINRDEIPSISKCIIKASYAMGMATHPTRCVWVHS